MRLLLAMMLGVALAGCTIRHECIPTVTPTSTTALGVPFLARYGVGHTISFERYGQPTLRFRLPTEPGTTTLEDLDAQRCTTPPPQSYGDPYADPCEPVTGSITVREVHPPEEGIPVGRLDADITFTGASSPTHVDYREEFTDMCHDVNWPDVRGAWPGPGQL